MGKRNIVIGIAVVLAALAAGAAIWLARDGANQPVALTNGPSPSSTPSGGATANQASAAPGTSTPPPSQAIATSPASASAPAPSSSGLIPDPAPYPEEDWSEQLADPASTYAALDAAQKAAVQAQALAVGFAATAGGDVAGLFQPGSTLPAAPITGASEVATRAEGSGAGLVGARGATAEFSVLVPFDASTAGGDVSGQALWQITMTGQADAWLADSAVLRGILP